MMQRYVRGAGVAGLLVLTASGVSGQVNFSGTDTQSGDGFNFVGIDSDVLLAIDGFTTRAAGFVDANVAGLNDAFDNAAVVTINGQVIESAAFVGDFPLGVTRRFFTFNTLGPLRVDHRMIFRNDASVARLDLSIGNESDTPQTADVIIEANSGADGGFQIFDTFDLSDNGWTTEDHWIVTDDADFTAGDPGVLFAYGERSGGIRPTSVSDQVSITNNGTQGTGVRFTLDLLPFEEQTISVFYEIATSSFDLDFNSRAAKYDTVDANDLGALFPGTFGGEWSYIANFDIYAESRGDSIGNILDPGFWALGQVPSSF
ncbi:MAG: hypothetical protein AAFO89_12765, partial [Planctomycetota bacterium]